MGVVFGLLASLSITSAEIFGRRITNSVGPVVAASVASFLAMFTALAVAMAIDGQPFARDLVLGALSGLGFGLGISSYLQGVRVSSAAVVGPTTAALSTLIPFSYAALTETAPPAVAFVGAGAAVVGLGFVTIGGSEASNLREGLPLGLASGFGYGVGTAILIETSEASGGWSLVSQRGAAFLVIAAYAVLRRRPVFPPRRMSGAAAAAGLFAGLSSVFLLAGLNVNAAAAAVSGSLYPASSVLAGWALFHDAVSRWQLVGLVIVVAGISAIVLG